MPQNRVVRSAKCPEHNKPGIFRAVQPSLDNKLYWAFACHYYGVKREHIFLALPDKSAPDTAEGFSDWVARQKYARIAMMENKRQ